ncbi:ROK family transcriptional regulator [Saccharicrinis carchari]|uniref:ROK family transcriptional regulator n=1 Tax=Saccharicrinis carchari TaxID=1168039 RepID=UPI00163DDC7D|nr:ROK family transcriptional regulator [Saccharicrinis carchari]
MTGIDKKKFLTKKRIIKYLYRHGSLSGTDIAQAFNLSSPTTHSYINELIEEKLVESRGKGESIGGRRPNIYGLVKNSVYLLGIDLGRKRVSVALYNNELQNISGTKTRKIKLGNDLGLIDDICAFSSEVIHEIGISKEKILGVGINIPGLVDSDSGISFTYLSSTDKSLQHTFEDKLNLPVYIENDSKARALAEWRLGLASHSKNALVIQLDWGVGMGMILNGKLYKGNSGLAGEFSHILIEEDGELCICGKCGCLETIASGMAMVKQATLELKNNAKSVLHRFVTDTESQISPEDIVNAAREGDQFAINLINNMGQKLGKGISYLLQILNPELIILGGTVSRANEYLLTPIKQSLLTYCIPKLREDTRLMVSELGKDAGVLGAISVVLERSIYTR